MIPLYGGFLNCGYPKIQYIVYIGKSIYQWMIWVHLHFRKPPYDHMFPWLHRNLFSSPVFRPSQPPWSHPALLQVTMKSRYLAQLPPGFKISKVGEFAMSDEKNHPFLYLSLEKIMFSHRSIQAFCRHLISNLSSAKNTMIHHFSKGSILVFAKKEVGWIKHDANFWF